MIIKKQARIEQEERQRAEKSKSNWISIHWKPLWPIIFRVIIFDSYISPDYYESFEKSQFIAVKISLVFHEFILELSSSFNSWEAYT